MSKLLYKSYERLLLKEVKSGPIPHHIAIIQDGNRRYAEKIGQPRYLGHFYGAGTTEKVMDWCWELGVKHLTLYSFSTENFKRSEIEKRELFNLLKQKLKELCEDERTHKREMRVRAIGKIDLLPPDVVSAIKQAESLTKNYDRVYLNIALAYGGRCEIVDAARKIAQRVKEGRIKVEEINEDTISAYLYPDEEPVPKVDLIIRTGGEGRTSNFLPWQASGYESAVYFCAPLWPEFRKIDFLRAVRTYQLRENEKRRKTVLRIFTLLQEFGKAELEEIYNLSRCTINITKEEVGKILREVKQAN
ncbi:MAG: polyprenyl diphosphate synthase [Methanocellales archaeon]